MKSMTKMIRTNYIENVYPGDLDDDIQIGLQIKEQELLGLTDEYVAEIMPDLDEIEKEYKDAGLDQYVEKIMNGEMDLEDLPRPKGCKYDLYMRYTEKGNYPETYSSWIKEDKRHMFTIEDRTIFKIQFMVITYGENASMYYAFHDTTHVSGILDIGKELTLSSGRLFFRDDDLDNEPYAAELLRMYKKTHGDAMVLLTDGIDVNYTFPEYKDEDLKGTITSFTGKQWMKTDYIMENCGIVPFTVFIDNRVNKHKSTVLTPTQPSYGNLPSEGTKTYIRTETDDEIMTENNENVVVE